LCYKCKQTILQYTHVGDKLETARGKQFTIANIQDGKIHIETSSGAHRWFHLEHVSLCLHWIIVDRKTIEGVGSNKKNSIRGLVGVNGILVQCQICERNPAYIWGILATLPQVKRKGENKLVYQ
jgi:hypothetical protein